MKTVSMLEFRKNAGKIIRRSQKGERLTVTYRGRPVMRIEPVVAGPVSDDDPFYRLAEYADNAGKAGTVLDNSEIDRLVYGI